MILEPSSGQAGGWRRVNRGERRWVLVFAVLVMLSTTLPYLLGYAAQGSDYRFTGFVFGAEDGNSYIAKMLSGWAGDWLFRSPYTAYPQNGLLMFFPYILLGKLAAPPALHEQLTSLYHIFRFGAGMLAIFASYDFLAYFIQDIRWRRFGVALISLGGGLGWLLLLIGKQTWLGSLPLDFYSPEAFGFLSLYGLPHLALARAMLLWALLTYLRWVESYFETSRELQEKQGSQWRLVIQLSLLWLLAGLMQPLTLLLIGALITWHLGGMAIRQRLAGLPGAVVNWSNWRQFLGLLLAASFFPGCFALYNIGISVLNPYARLWTAQNTIHSPHVIHYLLAYIVLIPYAWVGGRQLLHRSAWRSWLPIGWVLLFPLLAYAPINLQRRMTEGVWAAWCVLAMAALDRSANQPSGVQYKRMNWRFIPLWLAFPSTLFLVLGGALAAQRLSPPIFRSAAEAQVFEFLQIDARPRSVVLASYQTSNALPAWAPVSVLVGHGPESIHKAELEPQIAAFYQLQTPDAQRQALIRRFEIKYIFWGPAERALGDWLPADSDFLELATQQSEYALYQVRAAP